jgi:hypothetical protein
VNIGYDQMQHKGYTGRFNDEYRTIHLNILPKAVDACSVTPSSYKNMLLNELLTKLQGVKEAFAVTTLSLRLKKPGIILVPTGLTESISPADQIDGDFYAMSRIGRVTSIRLHHSRQEFPRSDQLRLQTSLNDSTAD